MVNIPVLLLSLKSAVFQLYTFLVVMIVQGYFLVVVASNNPLAHFLMVGVDSWNEL